MKKLSFLFVMAFLLVSCGGRAPSAKSAASMTRSYFKSYGNKYKTSVIGQAGVDKAQVNGIREVALNLAEIDGLITFKNGQAARVLITTKNVPPFGWKISSWEMMGIQ